jgi:hypothetical protein
MGFLKNESLQVIVDAPRDSGIYNFGVTTTQSMPINESGLLVKFFIAAKFDHTISSGWPHLQIRRRIHTSDSSYLRRVFITTMEPRPTGYLNVFEYDVQNMTFNVQSDDIIRVFWPSNTNVLRRRYSLAYFRDNSNVMLSIEISQPASTTVDDSISTPEPQTTMRETKITTLPKDSTLGPKEGTTTMSSSNNNFDDVNSVSSHESQSTFISHEVTTEKGQNQVSIVVGGVLCAMASIILVVVLTIITVFVAFRCRNHTKDFSPNTNDLKTSAPVVDNPTYSLVDGEFR